MRAHVDLPHHVAVALDDEEIAAPVEAQLVRHVERSVHGRAAVAAIAALAASRDGGDLSSTTIQAANALVVQVTEVQAAVRTDDEPVRIVDLRIGVSGGAGADDDGDSGRRAP
jgi:hypothetical protein